MCLAIPGKVLEIKGKEATVDFGGVKRSVKTDLVNVKPGEYVIVHAGYAIEVMSEEDALETLKILEEMLDE
ncbi:MAG: HypC/HybG/HupF family hydrogenase formation chaperone [Candidatus Altiarchaeia archaeon]